MIQQGFGLLRFVSSFCFLKKSAGASFRLRPCCLPLGVLEPELSSHLACASFITPLNALLVRCVRQAFGCLGALGEHGGQKTVHLLILNQSELSEHRHTEESPGHFRRKPVKSGREIQQYTVVEEGLGPNDRVVTSGCWQEAMMHCRKWFS